MTNHILPIIFVILVTVESANLTTVESANITTNQDSCRIGEKRVFNDMKQVCVKVGQTTQYRQTGKNCIRRYYIVQRADCMIACIASDQKETQPGKEGNLYRNLRGRCTRVDEFTLQWRIVGCVAPKNKLLRIGETVSVDLYSYECLINYYGSVERKRGPGNNNINMNFKIK